MAKPVLLRRSTWRGAPTGLACALAIGAATASFAPLRGLEDWALDYCFASRGTRRSEAQKRVVLVGLDEPSLDALGKPLAEASPELADVVRHLDRGGAAAVGIDLMVPEVLARRPEAHAGELGAAAAATGKVVLPAMDLGGRLLKPPATWLVPPAAPALVNTTEDDDQFARRQQLTFRVAGEDYPHFALALLADATGAAIDDADGLRLGDAPVPLDGEGLMRINYVGPPGSFRVVPFRDVLAAAKAKSPPDPALAGAIVIVGVTARGQQDYHATPYANNAFRALPAGGRGLMSGPELHANVLATLADRAFITTPAWLSPALWLPIFGVALGMAFARLSLEAGAVVAVAHHFFWKAACVAAFASGHYRIHMVSMLLLGATCYAATFAWRWRRLRRTFGVVKSEAIARALEADAGRLDTAGEERELTVLFADVRDFTSFSEAHTPHQVVALLNAYFTAVVPAIEEEGGTVDKYIGDGLMVLFGAPGSAPDHAARAVRAAAAMIARVHAYAPRWAELGFPGLRIGVGVHTGPAVVGTMGSPRRLDFTAIGDTVNAAARIEAENKAQGTEVLISAETYAALDPAERVRLGCDPTPRPATVKGRQQSLDLHEVVAPALRVPPTAVPSRGDAR
jgi:class 3 adenylate cyclase/CHASE2 domain-containing sensor protein